MSETYTLTGMELRRAVRQLREGNRKQEKEHLKWLRRLDKAIQGVDLMMLDHRAQLGLILAFEGIPIHPDQVRHIEEELERCRGVAFPG